MNRLPNAPAALVLLTLSLSLFCLSARAASQFDGEWQSSREKTMAFIEAHVIVESKTLEFHRSSFGRLRLSVADGRIRSNLPDHEVTIAGESYPMAGLDETHSFTVLHEDPSKIVIRSTSVVTGNPMVATFHFESPDVMWLYIGGGEDGLPTMHLREYFVRVEDEEQSHN